MKISPRKVVSYSPCPDCTNWSCGVQANGRFVRHSPGFGSVEHSRAVKRGIFVTSVCPGSGKSLR